MHCKHIHACIHTKWCVSAWWNYKIQCKYILAQCVMHTRNMNRIFHTMTAFIEWNVPIDFQPSPKYFNKISPAAYDALFWHACSYLCAEVHIEFYCFWMMSTFDPILDVYVWRCSNELGQIKFKKKNHWHPLSVIPINTSRVFQAGLSSSSSSSSANYHLHKHRTEWHMSCLSIFTSYWLSLKPNIHRCEKKDHPSIYRYVDACRWFFSLKFECYLVDTMWELS